jgi:hypothetical protein
MMIDELAKSKNKNLPPHKISVPHLMKATDNSITIASFM